MLKGGVIMDVVTPEEARIAEEAGAVAVMALERVPADIRRNGGVARMSDPQARPAALLPLPCCMAGLLQAVGWCIGWSVWSNLNPSRRGAPLPPAATASPTTHDYHPPRAAYWPTAPHNPSYPTS